MKQFNPFVFDKTAYERELTQYRTFLQTKRNLSENKDILPFFKQNQQVSSQMGRSFMSDLFPIDNIAFEYDLFGDFVCDLVLGNQKTQSYCFVEFEDASENSIFTTKKGKYQSVYAPRFEQGHSQAVDWFYKIRHASPYDLQERFGSDRINYYGMLVIGRSHFLTERKINRYKWRKRHVLVDSKFIIILTFDELLQMLETPYH